VRQSTDAMPNARTADSLRQKLNVFWQTLVGIAGRVRGSLEIALRVRENAVSACQATTGCSSAHSIKASMPSGRIRQ